MDEALTADELNMWKSELPQWQQNLLLRLERSLGRTLVAADLACIVWNSTGEALTVEIPPLLLELRSRGLISNVFRSQRSTRQ